MLDCAEICNPMLVANYCEEDLVGRVKRKLDHILIAQGQFFRLMVEVFRV